MFRKGWQLDQKLIVRREQPLSDKLQETVAAIRSKSDVEPRLALVLGSGLGDIARNVDKPAVIPFADLPHFPIATAPGHRAELVLGRLEGQPVVVLAGRLHLYEGYSAQEVAFPVQATRLLGARILLITNAAGGINQDLEPGSLMLITDHINLTGQNPLVGESEPELGPRFPDLTDAYNPELRDLAIQAAADIGVSLKEGVYIGMLGPSYETPAEIRMARTLGADAVGMSTVLEVIAANQCGMKCLGISCITNVGAGLGPGKLTEEEVLDTAHRVQGRLESLIRRIVSLCGTLQES